MTFDPNTISHLGIKMYSQVPSGLAELIANAYDADATEVKITLYDKNEMKIVVEDNGCGMSPDEVNDNFLRIGRNRRENPENIKTPKGRIASGKKGLGKLALFGLGSTITIQTKTEESEPIKFSLDWDALKKTKGDYHPEVIDEIENQKTSGTKVTISNLKRSSPFDQKQIANSIAKLFVCFDNNFEVSISVNDGKPELLDNESKFIGLDIEFEWEDFSKYSYACNNGITGRIITTMKPLKPGMRGISLYASGRLVNLPEFYGNPDSSHFYSYATGTLNVDFIDEYSGDDDLIATNRQALNWEHKATIALKGFLQKLIANIQIKWREERKEKAEEEAKPHANYDRKKWLDTLPKDKADAISNLLDFKIEEDALFSQKSITNTLYEVVPEYATLHWRYLHSNIKNNEAATRLYEQKNYYQALTEALKVYISQVRAISKSSAQSDYGLMGEAFKEDKGRGEIQLTKKETVTERNIEQGHADLSRGVVIGFRNPLAHIQEGDLRDSKLMTEEDCLDILSLLSHLFSRLDRRISPPPDSRSPFLSLIKSARNIMR